MYDAYSNPFGSMLHVRFAERKGSVPRRRMIAELLDALNALNAFDGDFLPEETPQFIRSSYCESVPHHGVTHPLFMVLTAASSKYRLLTPPKVRLGIVGHDCAHDGRAGNSPESLSAAVLAMWLRRQGRWLKKNGLTVEDMLGFLVANPQCATADIMATHYPYEMETTADLPETADWLRWYDTARTASGASAYVYNEALKLNNRMTPFRALLLESFGMNDETVTEGNDVREHLLGWMARNLAHFLNTCTYYGAAQVYPGVLGDVEMACRANAGLLELLLNSHDGQQRLLALYDVWKTDITIAEYVAACDSLDIP